MPNTKVTRQKWKDHLSYAKKVYIIGALVAIAIASVFYTVTRYIPPDENAVAIQLVDSYVDTTKLDADVPVLLEKGQAFDSALEELSFLSIAYSGKSSEYDGSQLYAVQVYAGGNDIFIQNELLTNGMYEQGYLVPLDTLEGFEEFNKRYPETVLWLEEFREEGEATPDEPEPVVMHAYAVDLSSLLGFNERGAIDIRGKYAIIAGTSKNQETSFHVLTQLFEQFQPKGGE